MSVTLNIRGEPLPWETEMVCTRELSKDKNGESVFCNSTEGMKNLGGWCQDCKDEVYGESKVPRKKWAINTMQARLRELSREAAAKKRARDIKNEIREHPEMALIFE